MQKFIYSLIHIRFFLNYKRWEISGKESVYSPSVKQVNIYAKAIYIRMKDIYSTAIGNLFIHFVKSDNMHIYITDIDDRNVPVTIKDKNQREVLASFKPTAVGEYMIDIRVGDEKLPDGPHR